MDRASLERLLGQGLSLAEIGRRAGRHEATVGYWLRKHGLQAVGRAKHAARGGIGKEELEVLIVAGMSISEIAEEMNCSKGTVRHWLTRYGLKTHGALGRRTAAQVLAGRTAGLSVVRMRCPRHGEANFCLDKRGYYRCKRCRSESVARRRRKMKEILVREAGGACQICGYDRDMRALHFHHLERSSKRHEINARGAGIALDKLRSEARKCVLLCANCHAEVEAGLIALTAADGAP
jgi:transposase/5-methylcytosine-specific restriction endonuclease McrA